MIKILKGDLLQVKKGIIGHQVNCMGVMGSGVAVQVKKKYPIAFDEYRALVEEYDIGEDIRQSLLGSTQIVPINDELYIANMFGQFNYGSDGKKYTKEEKLFECFKHLRQFSEESGLPVYLPYLVGCYRGGADWNVVENYLNIAFDGHEVTLYKL